MFKISGCIPKLHFNKNSFCFTPFLKVAKKNFITNERKNGIHPNFITFSQI